MASLGLKSRYPLCVSTRFMALVGAIWLGATLPASLHADEGDGAAIAAILEAGWVREGGALDKAIAAHKAAPADWRSDYAMALVYFQHRRFAEAQASLTSAVKSAPEEYAAVEALLWLQTYLRQYDVALTNMRSLADALGGAATVSADGKPEEKEIRLARRMGELLGYLAGPARSMVPADTVESCRVEVSDRLPRSLIAAFEEGEQSVEDQFATAEEGLATTRDEDAADQDRKKEEELARIAEERDKLAISEDDLKNQEAKAGEEMQREISSIDKQIPDLQRRGAEVQTLALPIQRLINEMEFRASRQIANANASRDEFVRDAAFREADRIRFFISQERNRLEPLEIEAQNIAAQIARLAQVRAQQEARYQTRLAAIAAQRQKNGKISRILDRRDKDLGEDNRGSSARTRAQIAKLAALTTYVKFPLEDSKAALLADLRK